MGYYPRHRKAGSVMGINNLRSTDIRENEISDLFQSLRLEGEETGPFSLILHAI